MVLPSLTEDGELPLGVHAASLREVLDQFGADSAQRRAVALRLDRIYRVARATGHLARFVDDTFDASQLTGDARLLFDHAAAQAHFGASVFWVRHLAAWPGAQAAVEFWQVKRGGGRRGIVEIITEAS